MKQTRSSLARQSFNRMRGAVPGESRPDWAQVISCNPASGRQTHETNPIITGPSVLQSYAGCRTGRE
ncbi:hypothetical protein CQA72_29465 [Klebsiella pneumoniae]|nr:hypothetical protein CQA72_29465 [Klebsiella pneumoniae]